MKKILIAFFLIVGLNPCASYAFENTDVCFQYDPVIGKETNELITKYIARADKDYELNALDFLLNKIISASKAGNPSIMCSDLAKVCNMARWPDVKCLEFSEDLRVLWKLLAKRKAQQSGAKENASATGVSKELEQENNSKKLAKAFCNKSAEEVATIVNAINMVKTYNGHKKTPEDVFLSLQKRFNGSHGYQKCFEAYGYTLDEDEVIIKKIQ